MVELREDLASLFMAAAEAAGRRLQQAGIDPVVATPQSVIERDFQGPGSMQMARVSLPRNSLAVDRLAARIEPWLTAAEVVWAGDCGTRLAESARVTLPFWSVFAPRLSPLVASSTDGDPRRPEPATDLCEWVVASIVLPALRYHLRALASVEEADDSAALAFADEVIQVAHDDQLRYRITVPLSGIDLAGSAQGEFSQGQIKIRRLSAEEQGHWFAEINGPAPVRGFDPPPQVLLEMRVAGPRTVQRLVSEDLPHFLIAAFQLHGFGVAGRLAYEESDPAWVSAMAFRMPLTLPVQPPPDSSILMMSDDDFSSIVATSMKLSSYRLVKPNSPKDLAIHRYAAGMARQSAADTLLDFTIALEALLLPYDKVARRGDLGYRFRMHGAHYLTEDITQRTATAEKLTAIYEMRSSLVHGGKYPDLARITAVCNDARDLIRSGLLRSVHEGFPTAQDFNRLVLGVDPQNRSS